MQQSRRPGVLVRQCKKGGKSYQVVELDSGHTLIDTRDDLLCDCCSVDMLGVESVTQPGDTCCDLVELNAFFASIWGRRVSGQQRHGVQRRET